MRDLALAVLGVEGTSSPTEAEAQVRAVTDWLPDVLVHRDVRRGFGVSVMAWLAATMPRLFPFATDNEVESIGLDPFEEESEMSTPHLRVGEWEEERLRQGRAEGMERGLAQGLEQGRSLLCELAERTFGVAVGEELDRRLGSMHVAEEFPEVGVRTIDCADDAELLACVRPRGDA